MTVSNQATCSILMASGPGEGHWRAIARGFPFRLTAAGDE